MATAIKMPRQGQSVESCILTEWYKKEGDSINRGDLLFAYETDKAAFEEEVQEDGILLARFFEEGDEVPVLLNVAVIGAEGESVDEFRPDGTSAEISQEANVLQEKTSPTTISSQMNEEKTPELSSSLESAGEAP